MQDLKRRHLIFSLVMSYLTLTCNPKLNPQPIGLDLLRKKEEKISSNTMGMGGNSIQKWVRDVK